MSSRRLDGWFTLWRLAKPNLGNQWSMNDKWSMLINDDQWTSHGHHMAATSLCGASHGSVFWDFLAFTCFHMLSHAFTGNSFPFLMQAQNCITMHNYSLWLSICFMGAASNLTVCCQGAESWFDRRLPTCAGPSSDRFVFWRSSGHCSRGGDRMQSESVRCLKMSKNV